jgi:restriction endonuclease BglII
VGGLARVIPADIDEAYEVHEWRNAVAVLNGAHPTEWEEILTVLRGFTVHKSDVMVGGGRKSLVADKLDGSFYKLGWTERSFDTKIVVDKVEYPSPTHSVDCYKNKVALEIEWNNKDPFFDRDLNNFRLLFELRVVDVGIILTRCDALQPIFKSLGIHTKYGASTTHMSKLLPRVEGGGGGGCPILAFGIKPGLYDPNL